MGRKKHRSRDTPGQQRSGGVQKRSAAVQIGFTEAWMRGILPDGYVPLYQCPEVRMCVDAYADMISSMTIHLMQNTERGDVRVRNELSRVLDIKPNRYMNRKQFIRHIVNVMLTVGEGNCVVVPTVTADGYLDELIPLDPLHVVFEDVGTWGYQIRYGETIFRPEEVLHFAMNPDPQRPWLGTGFRITIREAVNSIRTTTKTKTAITSTPAPSLIIKADGLSSDLQDREGREEFKKQYFDTENDDRLWVIPAEAFDVVQVQPLTLSDLAIKDGMELDKRTIAGVMKVPPFLVGVGNYNDTEQQNFVNTGIMNIAQYIQQEFTTKLLYAHDLYWKFNPRSLYNYKITELVQAGKELASCMAIRRNEWRDWLGLPPDAEMDELLALENFIPVSKLGDQKKLKGGGDDGEE